MKNVMATVSRSPRVSPSDKETLRLILKNWMKQDRGVSYPRELREAVVTGRIKNLPVQVEAEIQNMLQDGVVTRAEYEQFRRNLASHTQLTDAEKRSIRDLVAAWMREDQRLKR
jgi:hypothetical protein